MNDVFHLQNTDGESLILWIDGYQFPQIENERYDSNWLNIGIEVQLKQGSWTTIDPSMLTMEVEQLIQWFIAMGAGKHQTDYFGFIEPCLRFKISGTIPCPLTVSFWAEYRPPWADSTDKFQLKIPLDQTTLLAIINSLERMLAEFPTRHRNDD